MEIFVAPSQAVWQFPAEAARVSVTVDETSAFIEALTGDGVYWEERQREAELARLQLRDDEAR